MDARHRHIPLKSFNVEQAGYPFSSLPLTGGARPDPHIPGCLPT